MATASFSYITQNNKTKKKKSKKRNKLKYSHIQNKSKNLFFFSFIFYHIFATVPSHSWEGHTFPVNTKRVSLAPTTMPQFQLDTIYLMDCLEGMKMIPDGSVDAIICDLPYEVLHKDNPHAQWDRLIPFEPLWREYLRVAKHNAAIVLFCQGMFTAKLMMSQPKLWRYNLVWDKCRATGFLNANRMPLRYHEDIAVFYRKLPTYNPQFEDCAATGRKPNHARRNGTHHKLDKCYGKYHDLNAQHIVVDGNVIENHKQLPPQRRMVTTMLARSMSA